MVKHKFLVILLIIIFTAGIPKFANAFSFFRIGVHAKGLEPYGSVFGVGLNFTLLDTIRLEATGGALRTLFHKYGDVSYGFGARVRLPFLTISPTLGVHRSWYTNHDKKGLPLSFSRSRV